MYDKKLPKHRDFDRILNILSRLINNVTFQIHQNAKLNYYAETCTADKSDTPLIIAEELHHPNGKAKQSTCFYTQQQISM